MLCICADLKGRSEAMNFTITVPTRSRLDIMMKWFAHHYDPKFHYCIAIEGQEWKLYEPVRKLFFRNVKYLYLKNNKGLGYARNKVCEYAHKLGHDFILMSDDDAFFNIEKVPEFIGAIKNNKHIIWMGGFFSGHTFYDKKLDEAKKRGGDFYKPMCAPALYALRLSYWNQEKFDDKVFYADDLEYWLRMKKIFYPYAPIYTYLSFPVKKSRHSPGGHMVWKTNVATVESDMNYINNKFGIDVISMVENKKKKGVFIFRTKWKMFMKHLENLKAEPIENEEERGSDEDIQLMMERDWEN